MAFRKKMKRSRSKKLFRKTAKRVHKKNFKGSMRGGWRL